MEIIELALDKLKPYDKNAKTHPEEQVQLIANSIKEFGFRTPIVVDEDFVIIQGHGRRLASQSLGLNTVPCVIADNLSKEQVKMLRLADNKVAESEWDDTLLDYELKELSDLFNVEDFGFEIDETPLIDTDTEDDIPTIEDNPVIKIGDIIKLDEHTVMCGDSTNLNDVLMLTGDNDMDMVWTDPPYNVNIEGAAGKIQNDNMEDSQFYEFLLKVYENYMFTLKAGGVIYVAHADSERVNFTKAFIDAGFKLSQVLIWNKNSGTLSRQDYNWKHEPLLYGWKEGAGHYYCNDFTQTTVHILEDDLNILNKKELINIIKDLYSNTTTVQDFDRPTMSVLHPTMKPIGLVQRFIENSSRVDESVLDLFGGAGSTLIAAVNSKRRSYTMELDEKYAQVIIQRYCDYTGNDTITINGDEVSWSEYKERAEHSREKVS